MSLESCLGLAAKILVEWIVFADHSGGLYVWHVCMHGCMYVCMYVSK